MKIIIIAAALYSAVIWVFWTVIRRWIYSPQVSPRDLKVGQPFTFYEHTTDGTTKLQKGRVVVNIQESECVYATLKDNDEMVRIEYSNISNLV